MTEHNIEDTLESTGLGVLRQSLLELSTHNLPANTNQMLLKALEQLEEVAGRISESEKQRRLAALYRVSQMLGESLQLNQVLDQVMDAVITLTGAERGFLVLHDPESDSLSLRAARNFEGESLDLDSMEVSRTLIRDVLESGRGVLTTNAQTDPRFADQKSVIVFALRSILCAPLQTRGRTTGVIYVDNRLTTSQFKKEHLELLNAFGGQAAVAIENARLYTQTDRSLTERVAELETLSQVNRELNAQLDLEAVVETTCRNAIAATGALESWLALYQPDPIGFQVVSDNRRGEFIPLDDPRVGEAVEDFRPGVFTPEDPSQSGSLFPLHLGGQPIGLLAVVSDAGLDENGVAFMLRLAARASVALENARLYQAVREADLAKSRFVSVVSHELRLPMTSIRGYTDLMLQGAVGEVSEPQREFLNVIRSNVERMRVLVSDLSDISRIETGRLLLETAPFSLRVCVNQVLADLFPKMDEKKQKLDVNIPETLPEVLADPNRVMQVLANLVSNAWKYTPEGGRIQITANNRDDHVWLEVADEGIGIREQDQEKLFSQFFRSEDPQVREQVGWGLGLNVTKQLVELMGGAIGVESEFGTGSRFWFTLPLASAQAGAASENRIV